jgi:hypothetical protein
VSAPDVAPRLQRSLAAAYWFHDVFYPLDAFTPPIGVPLDVSIPSLNWSALRAESDFTYRFSVLTLTQPAPTGALTVQVTAPGGEYVSFDSIVLTLPLLVSSPPQRSDFLVAKPLWPTAALRPPDGETAVRGHIVSPTAQPVADLEVEMWLGNAPVPPPGTPFTRSNTSGDFLFRFPLLKGAPGAPLPVRIRLSGGAIPVSPASLSIALGRTRIIPFQRT